MALEAQQAEGSIEEITQGIPVQKAGDQESEVADHKSGNHGMKLKRKAEEEMLPEKPNQSRKKFDVNNSKCKQWCITSCLLCD